MSVAAGGGDVAVLTGDLVASRGLPLDALDRARLALETAARDVAGWEPGLVAGAGVEFFRGDSWQLCLARPARWLRVALFARARLKALGRGFDTRIGVGLGPAERLDGERISRSIGLAFERSGAALDRMRRRDRLVLHADGAAPELPVVATLCAAVADRWTPGQAGAVAGVLGAPPNDTQARIAARIGIAQPTLARALAGARFEALAEAIAWTERG